MYLPIIGGVNQLCYGPPSQNFGWGPPCSAPLLNLVQFRSQLGEMLCICHNHLSVGRLKLSQSENYPTLQHLTTKCLTSPISSASIERLLRVTHGSSHLCPPQHTVGIDHRVAMYNNKNVLQMRIDLICWEGVGLTCV